MSTKLTFEAKMQGMEQVVDLLKKAEERMQDFGRVGSYSLEGVDRRMKEFQQSIEFLNKTKSSQGGIGIFDNMNELARKSNEFIAKSQKALIDSMRQEAKLFEQEGEAALRKIKEAETALETFRSKRSSMNEREFQEGEASRQKEIDSMKAHGATLVAGASEVKRAIKRAEGGEDDRHYGMWSTVGNMIGGRLGAAVAGVGPYAAGATMLAGGMQMAGSMMLGVGYTREMDEYIARANLVRRAAQEAKGFNPTTSMVRELGGDQEAQYMGSYGLGLKGAGRLVLGGFGLWGPNAGQIVSEERAAFRERQSQIFNPLFAGGGAMMQAEANIPYLQRIYGVENAHQIAKDIRRSGVDTQNMAPYLAMMTQQGLMPGRFMGQTGNFIRDVRSYSLDESQVNAIYRQQALNGGTLAGNLNVLTRLYGAAGLGPSDIAARTAMGGYAASMLSERGAGQDLGTVGASVAATANLYGPGFNKVEAVQGAISGAQATKSLMNQGGSFMQMAVVSKLRQLGLDPIAIDYFMKRDLTNPKTHEEISKYIKANGLGNTSAADVARALGQATKDWSDVSNATLGPAGEKLDKAFGKGAALTQFALGTRAEDNRQAGAPGAEDIMNTAVTAGRDKYGPMTKEQSEGIGRGQKTIDDWMMQGSAKEERAVNAELERVLEKTGQKVTDALTIHIMKGFLDTADQVRQAGERLLKDQQSSREENKAPESKPKPQFQGVKNKMSRGQQG